MLRVGTSWINQQRSESRIWNPNQKSKEFMLRLGRYISINNKKHQIRLVCDGALHIEDQDFYWLVLPQIEYTLASKKEHTKLCRNCVATVSHLNRFIFPYLLKSESSETLCEST